MSNERTDWHLMVITHGGTVSLLRNLTRDIAQQAYRKLDPMRNRVEGNPSGSFYTPSYRPEEVARIEVLGPEGETLFPL